MMITVTTEPGAAATLSIDGGATDAVDAPVRRSVQHRAELVILGWGRIEVARGSDDRGLDDIERDLEGLDRTFRDGVAPYGLTGREPDVLEQLRRGAADRDIRRRGPRSHHRRDKAARGQQLEGRALRIQPS